MQKATRNLARLKSILNLLYQTKFFVCIIMYYPIYRTQPMMDSNKLKVRLDDISEVNPALTCYHRDDPAPVLPLRDEPDLLSWLENTGRLVTEKDGESQEFSTIEEEELSALMGEKEDYKTEEDASEDDWED